MLRAASPRAYLPSYEVQQVPAPDNRSGSRIYDRRFWLASASNLCAAMTIALLFRYADLVERLGGGELELGWIVGTGMIGSMVIRFVLGRAIDQHGARATWMVSLTALSASCFGHLLLRSCHGPAIYVLRILFASSVAGVFGSSVTWISSRVPRARLAEIVGTLGASGFIAWALGNCLGDAICGGGSAHIERLFVAAGSFTLLAMVFCWLATAGIVPLPKTSRDSMASLLWRYSPRVVLLVGVAAGVALGLPSTFVRSFGVELGIPTMSSFFVAYAASALAMRIGARRFPERFGLAPVILLGLALLAAGLLAFVLVHAAWQMMIPAVILGFAHALIFPPTVAASTLSFPENCRGLGTMLILAAYDFGVLVGTPLAGAIVHNSSRFGLPPYPTMFVAIASLMGLVSLVFAASLLWRSPVAETARPSALSVHDPAPLDRGDDKMPHQAGRERDKTASGVHRATA